jgi:transposase-like protein
VGYLENQKRWQCSNRHPKRQFSIKVGTIMEDSPMGLDKWLPVLWLIANCRNGISSWEIHRDLGVTQKTAWFMLHRVRLAMQDARKGGKLSGEIEIDESYIGGKARNMHKSARAKKLQGAGGGSVGKIGVQGLLQRGGNIRVNVINDNSYATLMPNVEENVEKGAHVYTDELRSYFGLQADYAHDVINHSEMYVNGQIHLNGLENFWSLMKRGLGGTYVSVEPFHLFRYVDEQAFRYNHRKHADGSKISEEERFSSLCNQIVGRRLTYKQLTGKEEQKPEEAF